MVSITEVFVFIENCSYEDLLSVIAEANLRKSTLDEGSSLRDWW